MPAMNTPGWELRKENAAPLQRGRNVATLERSGFGLQCRKKSEQSIDEYERLVRPSEAPHVTEMTDDCLQHWLAYIKFYQESFPSDTHDQFLLMERCTRALIKMKQYADDDRFIGVCAKYADKTKDPMEVFKYLHQQKVGSHTALFWIAWAYVGERNNDFPFAEKIFKKGISKSAQPLQLLKTRHQQFQRRMSRHWLNNSQRNDQLDDEEDESTSRSRGVLGGISSDRLQRNDRAPSMRQTQRPRTFGARQPPAPSRQNSNVNVSNDLAIYVDEDNADAGYNLDKSFGRSRVIETQAERKKENTIDAERWNERGGLRRAPEKKQRSRSKGPPPAFAVFVDEECAAQHENEETVKEAEAEQQRRVRDERTFRERGDEGMAERLARDPLRYVKDPSQLQSDIVAEEQEQEKANDHPRTAPTSKSERRSRTGFSKRLLQNAQGEEQGFEEARANARFFTLASSANNFNLLHVVKADQSSQMDLDEDGSVDISMEDSEKANDSSVSLQPLKMQRVHSLPGSRALFRSETSFDASLNQTAISTASSTVHERDAVGVPTNIEEETINTKFAKGELSMMFSSPGFGADDAARKTEHAIRNQSDVSASDTSYDNVVDIMDHHHLDNSVLNAEPSNTNENEGPRNPYGRSVSTPGFKDMALRELDSDPDAEGSLSCRSPIGSSTPYQLSQENPLGGGERDLSNNPGFQVFEDEEAKTSDSGRVSSGHGFQVYEDSAERDGERREATAKSGFAIFEDGTSGGNAVSSAGPGFQLYEDSSSNAKQKVDSSNQARFGIFEDGVTSPKGDLSIDSSACSSVENGAGDANFENGDTATLSLFEDAVVMLNDDDKKPSYQSPASKTSTILSRGRRSDGDTATISLFNEVFSEIAEADSDQTNGITPGKPNAPQHNGGFDIFVDCDTQDQNTSDYNLDDNSCRNSILETHESTSLDLKIERPTVDYASIHERDCRVALRRLQSSSLVPDSRIPLQSLLSVAGNSFHLPHVLVPRVLRRKSLIPSKIELSIGKYSGLVSNELGRGTYGVVVLMEAEESSDESNDNGIIAVKAQTPTSCLALECVVLQRLEERIASRQSKTYPFPRPLSFVSLADGAIFSMTAGSRSGLNLVDLANIYKFKLGEPVPELIALHYTSRMLNHIEMLHWHGKILHGDVKPDNFVLCTLDCPDNNFRQIENSDLFLVDFGRAVDLDQFSDQYDDVRNVLFHGNACSDDMMCVAMKNRMPWSFDIDTYGILSSAHVLLFGSHMEIRKEQGSRWRPVKRFQRYWQKELWNDIFDSLLNLDEESGAPIGSRARNLRNLREKIDSYLETEKGKIAALLTRQSNLLPTSREKLG